MRTLVERFKDDDLLTSESLRTKMEHISNDIINGYTYLEDTENKLENLSAVSSLEANLANSIIKNLETKISDLEKSIGNNSMFMSKNFYVKDDVTMLSGSLNTMYGFISANLKTDPKIDFFQYPIDFLLKNFKIELNVYNNSTGKRIRTESINTNGELINILNNNIYKGYMCTDYLEDVGGDSIRYELIVGLPENILSSLAVNNICINPCPMYSLNLEYVEYRNKNGKYERLLGTHPSLKNEYFMFDPVLTNQLKFVFTQNDYIINNGKKAYTFGLRNLFINFVSILSNECTWVSKYTLNDYRFKKIKSCSLDYDGTPAYLNYEVYLDEKLTQLVTLGEELTTPAKDIYVKHSVGLFNTNIPIIKSETIEFDVTY